MKFKDFIDMALKLTSSVHPMHQDALEYEVVIRTSQGALSGQDHVGVVGIYWGCDWDKRRIIITPDKPLVPLESHRDVPKKPFDAHIPDQYKTKIKPYFVCPNCEEPLKKTWEYCPKCGQKLDWGK